MQAVHPVRHNLRLCHNIFWLSKQSGDKARKEALGSSFRWAKLSGVFLKKCLVQNIYY